MTTGNTDGEPMTPRDPTPQPTAGRFGNAFVTALVVAIAGVVLAAVLTPLGDHVMQGFLDEPTCPGDACEGKNPQSQGCTEDARTFKPDVGNPALLQIRYSEDCKAVWARIERGSPGDLVTVEVVGGTKRTAEIEYGNDKFTGMAAVSDGEFQVTACAVPKRGGAGTYERYCVQATEAAAWR